MPKLVKPLNNTQPENAKKKDKPYKLTDGGGLYLLVNTDGAKYWRMDYRMDERRNTLAFGKYPEISIKQARDQRKAAREQINAGIDPAQARDAEKQQRQSEAENTFELLARKWLDKTSVEHAATTQKKITGWIEKDVLPYIGKMPVSKIEPTDILRVAQRLETRGAVDSAHRVKQICGQILRYGVAHGVLKVDVTRDLRGALSAIQTENHPAITDPAKIGDLLRSIHGYAGNPYCVAALKLAPLVFVRPGELRSAEWKEFDLDAAEWNIPGAKMKMKKPHLVPLCTQALQILRDIHAISGGWKYVFPSLRTGERCMSENTLNAALRSMGYDKDTMTAHGFRAMARTVLDEILGERVDLIRHQMAHQVLDANGTAYNRTAHLPARRAMMQRWSDYLDGLRSGANVIPIRAA